MNLLKPEGSIAVQTTIEVSLSQVQNLLISALEGGSNYWCQIAGYQYAEGKKANAYEFRHVEVVFDGGKILLNEFGDEGDTIQQFVVGLDELKEGIRRMARDDTYHWKNIVEENDDAETGDVFLQMTLFDEIRYG